MMANDLTTTIALVERLFGPLKEPKEKNMIITVPSETDKKAFAPAPAGTHQGVCCDWIDLGQITTTFQGETKTRPYVRFIWEINEVNPETGKRFTVAQRYALSLHKKSNLTKLLTGWFSKTPAPGTQIDFDKLLGFNGMINVVHNEDDGTTYANVQAVGPLVKGLPKIKVSKEYVRVKDRPPKTENEEAMREALATKGTTAEEADDADAVPF